MTPAQYRAALDRLGLTQAEAAKALGISVRTSHGYANGWPIPKVVILALRYLAIKKPAQMEEQAGANHTDD